MFFFVSLTNAFTLSQLDRRSRGLVNSTPALRMSSLLVHPDELTSRCVLNKARECAFSEYSSATEAKEYLTKILEIESGCVSGVLAGQDLCENVDEVAEIVAHLRRKVERHSITPVTTTVAAIPVTISIMTLFIVLVSTVDHGQDAQPFTVEEWIWAAKGGYVRLRLAKANTILECSTPNSLSFSRFILQLHTILSHFIRNGGL